LRQEGQQIYQYNPEDSLEYLLYDFSKNAGDTLIVYAVDPFFSFSGPSALTLRVDSVTINNSGTLPLKTQWVTQLDGWEFSMEGPLIERIGWNRFFFPRYFAVDPAPGGTLLCFRDSVIALPASAAHCGMLVSTHTLADASNIVVFPNPTTNEIEVRSGEVISIEVCDRFLRRLSSVTGPRIELSSYSDGLYFLKITTHRGAFLRTVVKASRP
jgi:hypothetical protein